MKLLRNREIKIQIMCYFLAAALCGAAAGFFGGRAAGVICVTAVFVCMCIHLSAMYSEYRKIDRLSRDIDSILQGKPTELWKVCREGEIAALISQMEKVVVRLENQSRKERAGKQYLADALADISHQIKTPLTSIELILSLMSENTDGDSDRVAQLRRQTAKIEWMVYALLRISKLDAGTVELKQEPVPVKGLLSRCLDRLAISFELRELSFQCQCADDTTFTGDDIWMEEALLNVMKNCMEHMKEGGVLEITAQENPLYTQILIRDDGTGLKKEDIPHIFERFYRGKGEDKESVGIGLALSRKIILSQNGTIAARNRTDKKGAEFEIRIYKGCI